MSDVIFGIYQTSDSILIHNINISKVISIDKEYLSINTREISYLNTINKTGEYRARGILGILNIGMMDFLLYITSSSIVGKIGNKDIYEIKDINFLGISNNIKLSDDIIYILSEIRCILQQGFYYSHHYDLTNSLQNQKLIKIRNNYKYDFIRDSDKKFLWNNELYVKFFDYYVDSDFMINCICGYIGVIHEEKLDYILISRRSSLNAGVKLIKKGLDIDGHSANFVETEQIVIADDNIFSFVQVRGGPPLIFNDETIKDFLGENSNSDRTKSKSNLSFENHISYLLRNSYQLALVINLMNIKKNNEQLATTVIEELIRLNEYKYLKYLFFDYFNETNNDKNNHIKLENNTKSYLDSDNLSSVNNFLQKIENVLNIFKYFGIFNKRNMSDHNMHEDNERNNFRSVNDKNNKVSTDQVGIIRTCCYDGLERSNFMQKRIALKVLRTQLKEINVFPSDLFRENISNKTDNFSDMMSTAQDLKFEVNTNTSQINLIGKYQKEIELNFSKNESDESIEISVDKLKLGPSNTKPESNSFLDAFDKIWADNGVKLSIQYTGGVGIASAELDQQYIVKQNFKQRCTDIFLQKFEPSFMKSNIFC